MLNRDVLHIVCDYLDTPAIGSLRLVNRQWEDVASAHLFHTVVLRHDIEARKTIEVISQRTQFTKGVREIVLEIGHYAGFPGAPEHPDERAIMKRRSFKTAVGGEYCYELAELLNPGRRKYMSRTAKAEMLGLLSNALKLFAGVKKVRLTSVVASMDKVPRKSTPRSSAPEHPFFGLWETPHHERAVHIVIQALARTPNNVTTLSIDADREDPGCGLHEKRAMLVSHLHKALLPSAEQVFSRLKSLHLHLVGTAAELDHSMMRRGCSLTRALSSLRAVEDLSLRVCCTDCPDLTERQEDATTILGGFQCDLKMLLILETTLTALKRLALWSLYCHTSEFCDYLARHAATLEHLDIYDMRLLDGETYVCFQKETTPEDPVEEPHLWARLAHACQSLPRLESFVLRDAMEYRDVETPMGYVYRLHGAQVWEVTQLALTGRQMPLERAS